MLSTRAPAFSCGMVVPSKAFLLTPSQPIQCKMFHVSQLTVSSVAMTVVFHTVAKPLGDCRNRGPGGGKRRFPKEGEGRRAKAAKRLAGTCSPSSSTKALSGQPCTSYNDSEIGLLPKTGDVINYCKFSDILALHFAANCEMGLWATTFLYGSKHPHTTATCHRADHRNHLRTQKIPQLRTRPDPNCDAGRWWRQYML